MPLHRAVTTLQHLALKASALSLVEACTVHGFLKLALRRNMVDPSGRSKRGRAYSPPRKPLVITSAGGGKGKHQRAKKAGGEKRKGTSLELSRGVGNDGSGCPRRVGSSSKVITKEVFRKTLKNKLYTLRDYPFESEKKFFSEMKKMKEKTEGWASLCMAELGNAELTCEDICQEIDHSIASLRKRYTSCVPPLLRTPVFQEVMLVLKKCCPSDTFFYVRFCLPKSVFDTILSVVFDETIRMIDFRHEHQIKNKTTSDYLWSGRLEKLAAFYQKVRASCENSGSGFYPLQTLIDLRRLQMTAITYLDCGPTPQTPELIWAVGCSCPNLQHLFLEACEWKNSMTWYSAFWALVGQSVPTKKGVPVGCKRLRSLHMQPVLKSFYGFSLIVVKMLKFMPDLEVITGAPMLLALRQYLLKEVTCKQDRWPTLSLKKFHDMTWEYQSTPITGEEKNILRDLLKKVREVEVHFLCNEMSDFLTCLPDLCVFRFHIFRDITGYPCVQANLRRLKALRISMTSLDTGTQDILRYLPGTSHLQELKLVLGPTDDELDAIELPLCPSVRKLEISRAVRRGHLHFVKSLVAKCPHLQDFRAAFLWSTTSEDIEAWVCALGPHLTQVTTLAFEYDGIGQVFFSALALEVILASCPRLSCLCLFDAVLCKVLTQRALENNWELEVSQAP